jgi:hypothetical protein
MEFRIEHEGRKVEFEIPGVWVEMPNALPVVVMSYPAGRELCLELALQMKILRDSR